MENHKIENVPQALVPPLMPPGALWDRQSPLRYGLMAVPGRRATIVSMFSGCGGLDLGFVGGFDFLGKHYARTGFNIVWANEISPAACKSYRANFGEGSIVEGDVNVCAKAMPEYADIIIGGFPCQDISINGKMLGINGKRSILYAAIVDAVKRLRPKVFVAENVGSLLMKTNKDTLDKILADFASTGYKINCQLYNTADYGVPQTRERVFIVGTRPDMPDFVPPAPASTPPVTAKEAIGDLEEREENRAFSHIWSKAQVSGEQGNRRMVADRPGYTIRSECHGNIQFHYSLPRRISMREAARFQSFPDTFVFPCGLRETERQIGNAVPPVMAWRIAQAVKDVLNGNRDGQARI